MFLKLKKFANSHHSIPFQPCLCMQIFSLWLFHSIIIINNNNHNEIIMGKFEPLLFICFNSTFNILLSLPCGSDGWYFFFDGFFSPWCETHLSRPLRDICQMCFLHIYCNTVVLIFCQDLCSGAFNPLWSLKYSPCTISPHVFKILFSFLLAAAAVVGGIPAGICPSAQSGVSQSLPEISLCHQSVFYSTRISCKVKFLPSHTQRNEAVDTFLIGVVILPLKLCGVFQTRSMNEPERYIHAVTHPTSLENSLKNRNSELHHSDCVPCFDITQCAFICPDITGNENKQAGWLYFT